MVQPYTKRVNPNFYQDCTLTPRGKRRIDAKAKELRQSLLKRESLQRT